jgi:transglutaminase-like putative cysteine protease
MLELRAGDCDDMTILLAAMLKAIGHPVRLVLVGFNPKRKAVFTHIYLEAFYKGHWIPLDATMDRPMGWSPHADHKQYFPVD